MAPACRLFELSDEATGRNQALCSRESKTRWYTRTFARLHDNTPSLAQLLQVTNSLAACTCLYSEANMQRSLSADSSEGLLPHKQDAGPSTSQVSLPRIRSGWKMSYG
jgi:hypothetical protein